jgi:hypothetical protein
LQETNQSKRGSAIETAINVGSGYFIAFGLNLYFLPYFVDGISEYNVGIALIIGVVYTSVSMVRSFTFRRVFNKLTGKRMWL